MASEIRNRFTDTEMQIARETDLPELLSHLGYQVKRVGRFHTTAEMDSLRIKDRRKWFRYSQNTGGDAITFLQQFCGKSFPEAVEYEGYPRHYTKETVTVKDAAGAEIPVMVYIMAEPYCRQPALPSPYYYRVIQRGFEANGLPVESLQAAWSRTIDEVFSGKLDKPRNKKSERRKEPER